MVRLKMSVKYLSENWYMGSTLAKLATTKYKIEPRLATGRYFSRVAEIVASVFSASPSRFPITPDVIFESFRVLIRASNRVTSKFLDLVKFSLISNMLTSPENLFVA